MSKAAKRTHKSNLPLATHTIRGLLGLMSTDMSRDNGVELLITDFSDAFWMVP